MPAVDRSSRRRARRAAIAVAVLASVASPVACGGDEEPAPAARARTDGLAVYLSVPGAGDSAARSDAIAGGARRALRDRGGEAGEWEVDLVALDSSGPEPDLLAGGGWEPAAVARNAQRAAADPAAVAYIGELDLGGSAVSLPITNDAGLLQVSPADGLTSLTRRIPGDPASGPERYLPTGERNFLRLVPTDFLQASALVRWARELGARRLAVLHDGGVFGRELAAQVALVASCSGLPAVESQAVPSDPGGHAALAQRISEERREAVLYAGPSGSVAGSIAEAIEDEAPRARLLGAGGVAQAPLAPAAGPDLTLSGGVPDLLVTRAARPPRTYPPLGRDVLRRVSEPRGPLSADALYGYEAMSLVLDAIATAGGTSAKGGAPRGAVRRRALEPRRRRSVLGTYRIDRFGDVSESRFAGYRQGASTFALTGIRRAALRIAPQSRRPGSDTPCRRLLPIFPALD